MIVLKFGGTSVGTAESLFNVKKIVENLHQPAVVVVSALGGLTDRLIATAEKAASGDNSFHTDWEAMAQRHHDIINEVVDNTQLRQQTLQNVDALLAQLLRLYQGISLIELLPSQTLDRIVSLGEQMSSLIVAAMIPGASHRNSLQIIKTEKWFHKDIADLKLTEKLIQEAITPQSQYPVVMGGFISTDRDTGRITNLGRGGSDYTAALVAAALNAQTLQIWTDVDGFLTADPRIVADARVIERMSFVESMDLCTYGAKVIYPPTIYPVFHKNIPIRILNTHRPQAPGTFICDQPHQHTAAATGVSSLKNEAIITITSANNAPLPAELSTRALNALASKGIAIQLVSQQTTQGTYAFALESRHADTAVKLLTDEFAPEINEGTVANILPRHGLAAIAIVGDDIRRMPTLRQLMHNVLTNNGIGVEAWSDKTSETSLVFIIEEAHTQNAVNLLHTALFGPQPIIAAHTDVQQDNQNG